MTGPKNWDHDFDFLGSRDVIDYVTIGSAWALSYWWSMMTMHLSCTHTKIRGFKDSVCVRDIWEIFAFIGGFRDGPSNAVNRIFPRQTLVAMATKCGTKLAITRHMYEISPRFLHLTEGFKGKANHRLRGSANPVLIATV